MTRNGCNVCLTFPPWDHLLAALALETWKGENAVFQQSVEFLYFFIQIVEESKFHFFLLA